MILSKHATYTKACNISKIQKDIGKMLFPDPKDTSGKIHKDTSKQILLHGESTSLL